MEQPSTPWHHPQLFYPSWPFLANAAHCHLRPYTNAWMMDQYPVESTPFVFALWEPWGFMHVVRWPRRRTFFSHFLVVKVIVSNFLLRRSKYPSTPTWIHSFRVIHLSFHLFTQFLLFRCYNGNGWSWRRQNKSTLHTVGTHFRFLQTSAQIRLLRTSASLWQSEKWTSAMNQSVQYIHTLYSNSVYYTLSLPQWGSGRQTSMHRPIVWTQVWRIQARPTLLWNFKFRQSHWTTNNVLHREKHFIIIAASGGCKCDQSQQMIIIFLN